MNSFRKSLLLLVAGCCITVVMQAQPKVRRAQAEAAKQATNANNLTTRAQIAFPTASSTPEEAVWRRDVYREIDLTQPANAGLYYPVEPDGKQVNLFTYLFKLMLSGNVPAYEYTLDGNEKITDGVRVNPLKFLDNYHIYYEKTDKGLHIDNSDIPSKEVTAYYIRESSWFDRVSATFHTKVVALCPILKRTDDFGDATTPYPLFWMKYDDLAPFLAKQTMMPDERNNAATVSMDDYFTMNLYRGKIYKTNNPLGKALAPGSDNESQRSKEQARIEKEIAAFEQQIWGDKARKDSLDSIARVKPQPVKVKRTNARSRRTSAAKEVKPKTASAPESKASAPRVSVRRQRH